MIWNWGIFWGSFVTGTICFLVGYRFCYWREGVKPMKEMCDILTDVMLMKISYPEAKEKMKKIKYP